MRPDDPFILQRRNENPSRLALTLASTPDVDAAFVVRQVEGWQRLVKKVPSWAAVDALLYPPRLALEQCSGEAAARYKQAVVARLFPDGGTMADLTGGLGVDFSFMAHAFRHATYVERQAELCRLARHNFPLLGLEGATVAEGDGTDFLRAMQPVDLLFLDPARRDTAGRKTVMLEDCEPDVTRLLPLLREKARMTLLKLSPMLDWHRAVETLGCVSEVHIVAEGGECKDLLLVLADSDAEPRIHCADGMQHFTFMPSEESAAQVQYTARVGKYLYEPGAAMLKGGAFKLAAVRYGLQKLHPNSHLYTADQLAPDFPGRTFRVESISGFGKRELRQFCAGTAQANLSVRNFPSTVADLRRKLKLRDGGEAYWFATTLNDNQHVLVNCRKVDTLSALKQ